MVYKILVSSHVRSVQFSSGAQLCLTLCDPMNCSTPGLPVHHQLPEFTQTHAHWAVMPSNHLILCHSLLLMPSASSCPQLTPDLNLSQHQGLFKWVSSSHQVANRFNGLDLIDRVPDELWMEVCDIVQETGIKTIPKEKKYEKAKTLLCRLRSI